jgi:Mn-dependent DtxR family transcriptional regulator
VPSSRYAGVLYAHHLAVLRFLIERKYATQNIISYHLRYSRRGLREMMKHLRKYGHVECARNGVNSRWSLTDKGRAAAIAGTGKPIQDVLSPGV